MGAKRKVLCLVALLAMTSLGCNDDNDDGSYVPPDAGHDGGMDAGPVHLDGSIDASLDSGQGDSGT